MIMYFVSIKKALTILTFILFTITEANKKWSYGCKEEKEPNADHGNWKKLHISTSCLPTS